MEEPLSWASDVIVQLAFVDTDSSQEAPFTKETAADRQAVEERGKGVYNLFWKVNHHFSCT